VPVLVFGGLSTLGEALVAPATVILVHGMCATPSAWSRVVPVLDGLGVRSIAVQLPSCLPDSKIDDADSVRSLLDECGGSVVLAGHSFGGMVLTEVGAHASVRHLVYVDAPMLDVGEAVFPLMEGRVAEGFAACMQAEGDGFAFDAEALSTYFARQGWSAVDVQEFISGLQPQRAVASVLTPTVAAWRTVPSTLITCNDSEFNRDLRALFASRATKVIEMPGDHFPIWLRPNEVAGIVAGIAQNVA
jgi:pimeloyl-ACP methyl ester carboxylesterase